MVLTDIFRTFYPAAEYTLSSSTRRTFSRMDHMLGHKTSHKFKKIEIIPSVFSDHNGMKLKNHNRKSGKFMNTWKLTVF